MSNNVYSPSFKLVYVIHNSMFRILVVFFSQFEVLLPRYGQKCLFVGFENGCTVFVVLFLNIGGYFVSIRATISKIQTKKFNNVP